MRIDRLDLDGAWTPSAIVTRILAFERDLPIPVPIEELCAQLDIHSINDLRIEGFEAALLADGVKSIGSILVKGGQSRRRRRFSIAHELGHFLIPTHKVPVNAPLLCTSEQLSQPRKRDARHRMEVEANQFAAMMLIPPPILRGKLNELRRPDINDIVQLADHFDVSKEAMARSYAANSGECVAVVVTGQGRVLRHYRNERSFPWISVGPDQPVPYGSIYHASPRRAGLASGAEECEADIWLGGRGARGVVALTEQVLFQQNGFALILLEAELRDEDDPDDGVEGVWQSRF